MPLAAIARITGRYSGHRAGRDGIHRDFLDIELPRTRDTPSAAAGPRSCRAACFVPLQHSIHALLRRQDDRQVVGPAVTREQFLKIVFRVEARAAAGDGARSSAPVRSLRVRVVEVESLDHALHEGRASISDRYPLCRPAARSGERPTTG